MANHMLQHKYTDIIKSINFDYLDEQNVGDVPELKEEPELKKTKAKVKKSDLVVTHD